MKNLLTITYYEFKRLWRNPRLIILVVSQPIVIAIIVGLISHHEPNNIEVGLIKKQDNQYSQELERKLTDSDTLKVKNYSEINEKDIKSGAIKGFIVADISGDLSHKNQVGLYFNPTERVLPYFISKKVAEALVEISKEIAVKNAQTQVDEEIAKFQKSIPETIAGQVPKIDISNLTANSIQTSVTDLTPYKLQYFDYSASAMMVILVLLVILNLSGISITTERVSGTFERLFVTPYSKGDVLFGKALAQFIIGSFIWIVGLSISFLTFKISLGNIYLIILINSLVTASAVSLGLLISSITKTVTESVELAMYIFFINCLSTGIFMPINTASKYFSYLMKLNPFYYAVDISRKVNMLGASWNNISSEIYILAASFIVFLILSVALLRREAK